MSDLQSVDSEDCHGGVDAEALQPGQHRVGPDEEGDHVSEGRHRHRHTRVLHRLPEPVKYIFNELHSFSEWGFEVLK